MTCLNNTDVEVIFKNVGQGDSLIIEWKGNDGTIHIAIIDTKKNGKNNPVLAHIKEKKYTYIDFILLSHPHEDHYSGMLELLKYIESESIGVGWFGHTIDKSLTKDYWKLFESSRSATLLLERTLEKAIEMKRNGLIKNFELPIKNWSLNLSENVSLRAFSPSHDEIELYQKKVHLNSKTNKREASQAANLLSTVLILSNRDKHILITSDAENFSIDRIYKDGMIRKFDFQVVQVPHHGSKKNFSDEFWRNINSQKVAVISAGHNLKYKHPDKEVLDCLDDLKFAIHSTNISHGMIEFVKNKKISLLLDMVSKIDESKFNGGDKHFNI